MGVGRGAKPLLDFEIFSKKSCFLDFEWKKQIAPLLSPPGIILEKSSSAPPGKNPSYAHVRVKPQNAFSPNVF